MSAGILAIDVGGTGLKAAIIDDGGKLLTDRVRVPTPHPCPPALFVETLAGLVAPLPGYDRISIGFPGVVRDGKVLTAPNLGTADWTGFALTDAVSAKLGGHPARMINDAEMQGFGIIKGEGIELVVTLGTGCGTALFRKGELMQHMELAHHPIHEDKTYDEWLGRAALDEAGKKHWSKRVHKMIDILFVLLHYDHLYLGGGNAKHVEGDLPGNVTLASNEAGLEGGAALWRAAKPA